MNELYGTCDICGCKSFYLEDTVRGFLMCQDCAEENDTEKDIFAEIEVKND